MKINEIKINAYGNLKDKNLNLKDKINIIYGKNESGKSTILSYIINMFYGISTTKDGKSISDYEKYKPWTGEEFSGRIDYTLDNNKKYAIYRDFNKKKPKIFNDKLEDVSSEFSIDKKEGSKFFIEQTGVDKQMYLSTVVSMQQEVRLDEKNQNILVQKIANLAGTGEDSTSYKKANEKLQMKIRDEIGTSKTSQKPINILQKELENTNKKLKGLEPYENKKYTIAEEKSNILQELKIKKLQKEITIKLKEASDEEVLLKNKLEINAEKNKSDTIKLNNLNKQKKEYEEKNNEIKKEIEDIKSNNKIKGKKVALCIEIILFIILMLSAFVIHNKILDLIIAVIIIIIFIFECIKANGLKNKNRNAVDEKNKDINANNNQIAMIQGQIELLEKENETREKENDKIDKQIKENIDSKKRKIIDKYKNEINGFELKHIINSKEVEELIDRFDNNIRDISIKLNKLEVEESSIIPQLDDIVNLKEKQSDYEEKINELVMQEENINIAINSLKEAYEEMKTTITPRFTKQLSKNVETISNGKYKTVTINDENGMMIENTSGDFVQADKLSVGTIDQLYLSLRLSMIDELSNEKLPVILDETFAYFDNQRLENALKYLANELKEHQILIFTCSNRETQILRKMGVEFNLIEIES